VINELGRPVSDQAEVVLGQRDSDGRLGDLADEAQLRLPRIDGHELSPKKGLNDDQEETGRGNAPAV
jgi:hypothetical protein